MKYEEHEGDGKEMKNKKEKRETWEIRKCFRGLG